MKVRIKKDELIKYLRDSASSFEVIAEDNHKKVYLFTTDFPDYQNPSSFGGGIFLEADVDLNGAYRAYLAEKRERKKRRELEEKAANEQNK